MEKCLKYKRFWRFKGGGSRGGPVDKPIRSKINVGVI